MDKLAILDIQTKMLVCPTIKETNVEIVIVQILVSILVVACYNKMIKACTKNDRRYHIYVVTGSLLQLKTEA